MATSAQILRHLSSVTGKEGHGAAGRKGGRAECGSGAGQEGADGKETDQHGLFPRPNRKGRWFRGEEEARGQDSDGEVADTKDLDPERTRPHLGRHLGKWMWGEKMGCISNDRDATRTPGAESEVTIP